VGEKSAEFAVKSLNQNEAKYEMARISKRWAIIWRWCIVSTLLEGPYRMRFAFEFVEPTEQLHWLHNPLPSGQEQPNPNTKRIYSFINYRTQG